MKYRAHVTNDPDAADAYKRLKKALGLAEWEPPSDAQRTAFDYAFIDPEYRFEKFLELAAKGCSMADCLKGARI